MAGMVSPSGEGEIKGRAGHPLSPLGGKIGEELSWVKEKGAGEFPLRGRGGRFLACRSAPQIVMKCITCQA